MLSHFGKVSSGRTGCDPGLAAGHFCRCPASSDFLCRFIKLKYFNLTYNAKIVYILYYEKTKKGDSEFSLLLFSNLNFFANAFTYFTFGCKNKSIIPLLLACFEFQ